MALYFCFILICVAGISSILLFNIIDVYLIYLPGRKDIGGIVNFSEAMHDVKVLQKASCKPKYCSPYTLHLNNTREFVQQFRIFVQMPIISSN